MFPVEIAYLAQPTTDYVESAVQTIFDIHAKVRSGVPTFYASHRLEAEELTLSFVIEGRQEPKGDILVFLTGREEIDRCLQEIADRLPTYVVSALL